MTAVAKHLLEQARSLPPAERAEIADELLSTLDEEEGLDNPEFIAEFDRRIAEADAHPERSIPWTEAREILRRSF